jgi:capsular exopolysaccharide synthesis family protein
MTPIQIAVARDGLDAGGGAPPAELATPEDSRRTRLLNYWHALARRRLLIAGIVLAAVAAGLIITLLTHPLYTARAQIEISRVKKNVTNVQGVDQDSNWYDSEFYETQYALLKVDSLAVRVARKLQLADNPDFFTAHGVKLPAAAGPLDPTERKRREALAAGMLRARIGISPVRNSSLVNVTYTSRSPVWSARIANAWPQEFIAATMDRDYASNADARRFLEGMLGNLRARLEESERAVLNFAAERDMVKLGGSRDAQGRVENPRTLVETDLDFVNTALLTARTERIAAASRVGGGVDLAAEGAVSRLRARREELAADYSRLLVQFEPAYPAARALKAQIDAIDAAIGRESQRARMAPQLSYAQAVRREQELGAQFRVLKARLDAQQRDNVQYNIFQREADTNRQLYDALLQRYKEVGVAGSVGTSNVAIVDPAKVPAGPSSPNLMVNLATALLAGIVLALAAVFALEQIDERVRNPADVQRLAGIPLLGTVPRVEGDPGEQLANAASELSEAYFSIRTVLAFATSHGMPHSFLVSSSEAGEGKSTTALALAIAIARTGKRALLIDADMRSPSAHRLVGNSNARGFSNLLAGEDAYRPLVAATETEGLSILPAGPNPPSASELLGGGRLHQVLDLLRREFDFLVIDGPPVLGLADAPLLAQATEGCVFVIEAEETGLTAVHSALGRLRAVSSNVFGAIVTKLSPNRFGYGYGYHYEYHQKQAAAA